MHYSTVASAATLLALAPSALAVGCARLINNCDATFYFASVAQNTPADMVEIPAAGYEETYSLPDVGVSIKLSPDTRGLHVNQFEFTWAAGNIYYDVSNIDGNWFSEGGLELVPSEAGAAGYPTCVPIICPAGNTTCTAAYNNPDDVRTMVCPDSSELTMTLCPNSTTSTSSSTTPSSSAEPTGAWTFWHRSLSSHSHGHRIHSRHLLGRK